MANFCLHRKVNLTVFADNRNILSSSLEPTPARLEDSRDSHQRSREKRSTTDLTHARMLQPQELGLATTVTNILKTSVSLNDLQKRENLRLGWIQCDKSSRVWWINKLRLSSICLLEEKQYALVGYRRLIRTNAKLSTASRVTWWQNDIARNQESTIMIPSRLSETNWFSGLFSLLLYILKKNCSVGHQHVLFM